MFLVNLADIVSPTRLVCIMSRSRSGKIILTFSVRLCDS